MGRLGRLLVLCAAVVSVGSGGVAWAAGYPASWTTPLPPFRIAPGLYDVGSRDLAAYLVTTPAGDILINANIPSSVPQIEHSIEQLGFRVADVKVLLNSQAHFDHVGGEAGMERLTHASVAVMAGDAEVMESGGRTDFAFGPKPQFAPVHVDRVLHDGDTVTLGGVTLTAHRTAGHTRGCTTWTMPVKGSDGRVRQVVIVGGWAALSKYRLVPSHGRPASYPGIAEDFEHAFAVYRGLPCDIFLGAHGEYFDMLAKLARRGREGEAVWVDPAGYRAALEGAAAAFERDLQTQEQAAARDERRVAAHPR